MKKYNIYSDPGHAWLAVPIVELEALGIADKISHCSYIRGGMAYLEEDCDATLFIRTSLGVAGDCDQLGQWIAEHVRDHPQSNSSSRIRSYNGYSYP